MDLILNLKLKFEAKPHEFNCGIERIGDKNFDYYSHHGAAEMYNDVVCQMLFPHEEELLVVMTSGNASFCFFFCNRNLPTCVFSISNSTIVSV